MFTLYHAPNLKKKIENKHTKPLMFKPETPQAQLGSEVPIQPWILKFKQAYLFLHEQQYILSH